MDVKIVYLDATRIAAAHGFGPSPEGIAWEKILAFIDAQGIDARQARFFGFNNPDPDPGSPNYGYEQWVTVGPDVEPAGEVGIKQFDGGRYAVTRCKLTEIGATWKQLVHWREDNAHECGGHQYLEETITPPGTPFEDIVLDIYLPLSAS